MPFRACEANQTLANRTIDSLLENGESIFTLDDWGVNRMLVCGECATGGVDYDRSKKAFRISMDALISKVDRYDEWGEENPIEVQGRRVETRRVYREKEKVRIKSQARSRAITRRIEQLRKEVGR